MEHWRAIRQKCEAGELTLVVSEVVLLEAEKLWQQLLDDIDAKLKGVEKSVADLFVKPHDWSEIKDVARSLAKEIVRHRDRKKENAKLNHDEIDEILRSSFVKVLEYTPEVHFRAKRRLMAGKFPKSKDRSSEADCAIIESLINFFGEERGEKSLLFCSENHTDFGLEIKGRYVLHPLLQEGLPPTEFCLDLKSVVDFILGDKSVVDPPAQEIADAVERDREATIDDRASMLRFEKVIEKVYGTANIELTERERKALTLLMRVRFTEAMGYSYDRCRDEFVNEGFDEDDVPILLMRLQKFGLVERIEDQDWNGNQYWLFRVSDEGQEWCLNNHQTSTPVKTAKKLEAIPKASATGYRGGTPSIRKPSFPAKPPEPDAEDDDIPF